MSHAEQYQGKNLAYLLLAIALPAGLLYVRLVLGLAATDSRVTAAQSAWLARGSIVALALFFVAQLACAFYIRRLLPARRTRIGQSGQYLAVLAICVVFSLIGMTLLEAFGLNFFIRAAGPR